MVATTIQIMREGQPVPNVFALVSELNKHWQETDEEGKITANFDDGTALCGLIAIKDEKDDIFKYILMIEAGGTQQITIPNIDIP